MLRQGRDARQVSDALDRDFRPTAARRSARRRGAALGRPQVAALATEVRRLPGAAAVAQPGRWAAATWQVDVISRTGPLPRRASAWSRMSATATARHVAVQGQTARFIDQQASLGAHLPLALVLLATTTLLVLFAMTGSVVLPVKALLMNLLTLSAAFGILVLVFQDGRLEGLLSYSAWGRWTRPSRSCCS